MSAEFDDVLTNQPVVIDNVCSLQSVLNSTRVESITGFWYYKSGLCRTGSPKMLLSFIVRMYLVVLRKYVLRCKLMVCAVSVVPNTYASWQVH